MIRIHRLMDSYSHLYLHLSKFHIFWVVKTITLLILNGIGFQLESVEGFMLQILKIRVRYEVLNFSCVITMVAEF